AMKPIISFILIIALPLLTMACESPEINRTVPQEFLAGAEIDTYQGWTSLENAVLMARENDKKIIIDVYTDWCGYCRRMEAETYAADRVKKALDEHFFAVRLNAESSERVRFNGEVMTKQELAMALGVTGYPTTIFLDTDGEPLGFQPGFIDRNTFERLLVYVGTEAYERNIPFDSFTID
ncbi:MAG: thioredoxin fold domain-containing protein, partial [Balneolales bacterium]|nr:thioredoxin fold domain-containing protein [Balneolales bacterium]